MKAIELKRIDNIVALVLPEEVKATILRPYKHLDVDESVVTCGVCGISKPLDSFKVEGVRADGRLCYGVCDDCWTQQYHSRDGIIAEIISDIADQLSDYPYELSSKGEIIKK